MHLYFRLFLFFVGCAIGVFLALFVHDVSKENLVVKTSPVFNSILYEKWFKKQGFFRKDVSWDTLRYGNISFPLESEYLYEKLKVICVILVKTEKNAKAAVETWTKGCNYVEFINLFEKSKKIPLKRSKDKSSWVLLCNKLLTIPDKYDWILVVHDYTFAILENLRYFIAPLNANRHYYLGHTVTFWGRNYNLGQAGYVLSKGALSKLKEKMSLPNSCSKDLTYWNKEDYYLGKQLGSLNITPKDTRDEHGLSTFHPYNWYHVFFPGENYYKLSKYPTKCCSKNSITFQAIEGDKMYTYYYLFYTLQLFIDGKYGNKPPPKVADDTIWRNFLKERNIPNDHISSEEYYKAWEDLIDDPDSFAKNIKREEHSDL